MKHLTRLAAKARRVLLIVASVAAEAWHTLSRMPPTW